MGLPRLSPGSRGAISASGIPQHQKHQIPAMESGDNNSDLALGSGAAAASRLEVQSGRKKWF
jgi:hypothetical protein